MPPPSALGATENASSAARRSSHCRLRLDEAVEGNRAGGGRAAHPSASSSLESAHLRRDVCRHVPRVRRVQIAQPCPEPILSAHERVVEEGHDPSGHPQRRWLCGWDREDGEGSGWPAEAEVPALARSQPSPDEASAPALPSPARGRITRRRRDGSAATASAAWPVGAGGTSPRGPSPKSR
jgi:hypothetical protein